MLALKLQLQLKLYAPTFGMVYIRTKPTKIEPTFKSKSKKK
jgi:hypothetical protein